MIVYYQEEGRRVKREEIRRSSRSIRGEERERERDHWKSVVGNLEEADCLELRKIPAFSLSIHGDSSSPFSNLLLLLRLCSPLSKPLLVSSIRFSLTSVRDHVFPRRVTIKVEINFLIRFTLAWLFGDAGHAGIQPRCKDALLSSPPPPYNLKFLIKVIADRGFLSASWISAPLPPCSRQAIVAADRLTATTACYY